MLLTSPYLLFRSPYLPTIQVLYTIQEMASKHRQIWDLSTPSPSQTPITALPKRHEHRPGKKVLWLITAITSLSQEKCPHHLPRRFLCQSSVHCVVSLSSPISNYCAKLKCSVNKSVLLLNGLSQECIGRVGHPTISSYRL